VTQGNNSVPGQPGYSAGPGWDPVTGLGSRNASALISNWSAGSNNPDGPATITASPNPIIVTGGATTGQTTLSWNAPGHNVVIQVNSPGGQPASRFGAFRFYSDFSMDSGRGGKLDIPTGHRQE
jgi:hypothetical protein